MGWLIPVIITGALLIAGRIFRPRIPRPRPDPFNVPNIEEGKILPVVFGTQAITPTIIEWGDTLVHEWEYKKTIQVAYFAGMTFALCEGPVEGLLDIQIGEKSLSAWPQTPTGSGSVTPVFPAFESVNGATLPATFTLTALDLWGGNGKGGGIAGLCRFYFGSADQPIDDRLTEAATAAGAPGASGLPSTCYMAFDGPNPGVTYHENLRDPENVSFLWGDNNPTPPTVQAVVRRFPAGPGGTAAYRVIGNDMNPAYAVYELMTHERWGSNMNPDLFDETSFIDAAATLHNEGLGISFTLISQTNAKDLIDDIGRHVGLIVYRHPVTGLYTCKLIREDYVVGSLPELTESNGWDWELERGSWGETINELKVVHQRFIGLSDAAGTVTGEVLTLRSLSSGAFWAQTAGRNISNVVLHNLTTSQTLGPLVPGGESVDGVKLLIPQMGSIWFHVDDDNFLTSGNDQITVDYIGGEITTSAYRFHDAVTRFYDNANKQMTNEVRPETADLHMFTTDLAAAVGGARLFRESSTKLDRVSWKANRKGNTLHPGMVLKLTVPSKNLASFVVRVSDVNYGDLDDETIEVEAIEDLFAHNFSLAPPGISDPPTGEPGGQQAPPVAGITMDPCTNIVVRIFPGSIDFSTELQRATDSAGGGATLITTLAPAAVTFSSTLETVSITSWWRARHVLTGWIPSEWTSWVPLTGTSCTDTGTATCVTPTITASTSETTDTGTLTLTITDSQARVKLVEFQTQVGTDAASEWTLDTASPYVATVLLSGSLRSTIWWRVTYIDCDGLTQISEGFHNFDVPNPPSLVARFDAGGLLVSDWVIDETAQSVKIAGSPVAFPSQADVDAVTALDGSSGTTPPLVNQAATPGSTGFVAGEAFAGLAGTGRKSALAYAQAVFPDGGIDEGDLLGEVCYREFLLNDWEAGVQIDDFPSTATSPDTITGVTDDLVSWKMIPEGKVRVRVQAFVRSTSPVGDIAVQYHNGSTWRYLDGVSGPFVDLATGLVKGAWAPVETAAAGDRKLRLILVNGNGTTEVMLGMVMLEWCVAPANTPDDPETGTDSGSCTAVVTEGLEYTSTAAMTSAGWFLSATGSPLPGWTASWTMDTGQVHGGSRSLKGSIERPAGAPAGSFHATKTYTGLTPNAWHTVSAWARQEDLDAWDSYTQLIANGTTSPDRLSSADTWTLFRVNVLSNSAGEIVVDLHRDLPALAVSIFVQFWWDDVKIQEGSDCDPSSGCSLVSSDTLAYTSTAAAVSAGWTFTDNFSSGTHLWSADTGFGHSPQTASIKGTIDFAGGGPMRASRTFTGLAPSTAHTVKVWAQANQRHWHDAGMALWVIGPDQGDAISDAGVNNWEELVVHGTTNGSGELVVMFERTALLQNYFGLNFWFSDLRIYQGGSC